MQQIIGVILESGKSALDMALYILLPIMVIMLALMKLLEAKGILAIISNLLAPFSRVFGIPGIGIFAMIKLLFVSFAAPMASLSLMDKSNMSSRYIASTLAMVFSMSQANATFPLAAMGLDLSVILASSVVGGLCASAFTYYLLTRNLVTPEQSEITLEIKEPHEHETIVQILNKGGQDGVKIVLGMLPMLILAIFLVNVLNQIGAIEWISYVLAPALALIGLPEATVLPIVTKFIAGGTAFMGVTIDLMNQGLISAQELNRMAGFVTNPLDVLGIALYAALGKRINAVIRYAIYGALVGILVRSVIHLIIF
ncbi:MAG: nucleoside recognition family protein [Gammaproteobacteria bacterium]|nr:nucleoside recognition family protein [Gammaproteobacteria bacterium]MBL7000461.1 nucleoside recognition family protein [Gammaproteobacteria bacterium]